MALLASILLISIRPTSGFLREDINQDGVVDIFDIVKAVTSFGLCPENDGWNPLADVAADGLIDIFDIIKIAVRPWGEYMPVALFSKSGDPVPVGVPIEFDPSESYDPDGMIVLYEWDWESDGTYDESTTSPQVVPYVYSSTGTWNVTLRVTDDDGMTDVETDTVSIISLKVIPEVPIGTLAALIAMIVAFAAFASKSTLGKKKSAPNL
jgi:hypothetical protein